MLACVWVCRGWRRGCASRGVRDGAETRARACAPLSPAPHARRTCARTLCEAFARLLESMRRAVSLVSGSAPGRHHASNALAERAGARTPRSSQHAEDVQQNAPHPKQRCCLAAARRVGTATHRCAHRARSCHPRRAALFPPPPRASKRCDRHDWLLLRRSSSARGWRHARIQRERRGGKINSEGGACRRAPAARPPRFPSAQPLDRTHAALPAAHWCPRAPRRGRPPPSPARLRGDS